MFTQTSVKFAPDSPIENKLSIMQVMVRCLAQIRVKSDFFYRDLLTQHWG